jgi:glycosyltransferase involved in cell wall biosynthesis
MTSHPHPYARRVLLALTGISTGGIGSYALGMSAGLRERGWDVHLMVTNEPGDLYDTASREFQVLDLSACPLSIAKVRAAARMIADVAPSVLVLNHCSLASYALPLLPPSVKPVAVVHSDDPRFYRTAAFMAKRIFRWVAPTPALAGRLTGLLDEGAAGRVRIIPHGVAEPGAPRDASSIRTQPQLAFIGHIGENKGADLLPQIFARIKREVPAARLIVCGSGPLARLIERELGNLGLKDSCRFLGATAPARVYEILSDSDVLLLPTRIEGFGLILAEAMMAGAVPVATRLEGITDAVVEDGITGLLADPEDVDGYARAAATLLANPARLSSMRAAAMHTARERYSRSGMVSSYEQLFGERDDRPMLVRRSLAGWVLETGTQLLAGQGPGGETGLAAMKKTASRLLA